MNRTLTKCSGEMRSYVETLRRELEQAEAEYEQVKSFTGRHLPQYGDSPKEEILQLLEDETGRLRGELEDAEAYYADPLELEDERDALCRLQGLARYC